MSLIATLVLFVVTKWILIGRAKACSYERYSWLYCRKWFVDRMASTYVLKAALALSSGTIIESALQRLLGLHLKTRRPLNRILFSECDLISVGEETFVAYATLRATREVSLNQFTQRPINVGRRCVIMENNLVLGGINLPDFTLLASNSLVVPPPLRKKIDSESTMPSGRLWLGNVAQNITDSGLSNDSGAADQLKLYSFSDIFEIVFVFIVAPLLYAIVYLPGVIALTLIDVEPLALRTFLLVPLAMALTMLTGFLLALVLRWTVRHPRLSTGLPNRGLSFVMLLVIEQCFSHCNSMLITETALFNTIMRLFGFTIGRDVYINTPYPLIAESQYISFGDFCVFDNAAVSAHRYKNGVFTYLQTSIGNCAVIHDSLVSPGSQIGAGVYFGSLSVSHLMETFPPWTAWQGNPTRSMDE